MLLNFRAQLLLGSEHTFDHRLLSLYKISQVAQIYILGGLCGSLLRLFNYYGIMIVYAFIESDFGLL